VWSSLDPDDASRHEIRARIFDAGGAANGNDFALEAGPDTISIAPDVTALSGGRFIVSWTLSDPDADDLVPVRAQIMDPTIFNGTAAADTWRGGELSDRINGGAGVDTLTGLGGDDLVNGDAGADVLTGGAGNDRLFGGIDGDSLNGGVGADMLTG